MVLSLATGLVAGCSSTAGEPVSMVSGASAPQQAPAMPGLPSAADLTAARREVAKLPLDKLAAQLVVPRQTGDRASAAAGLRTRGYGGYAVFRGNLPAGSAAIPAARSDNAAFARAVAASGRSWPAFISIDQEGGPVTRLEAPMTPFPAVMALGAARDPGLARRVGAASGAELRSLGYTVVLAPDADVTIGAADPTIGIRSPGSDPKLVARISTALAAGYLDAGILPTLKHFPGHGGVSADTHVGTVRQRASLAQLRARDLVPFAEAVRSGVPAIMTAHIV
ncbi:MAG: glycoside hydrolase family 3 N-terminal domain-containing protein, partial [Micrococcales bacterium]|nr:glycoside hydrolase family 3 N-terminal domain-containing protein [Micrococcales bacterium]